MIFEHGSASCLVGVSSYRPIAGDNERLRVPRVSWSSPGYDWDEFYGRWRDPGNGVNLKTAMLGSFVS